MREREPNILLYALIDEAGMSHDGFASRVNQAGTRHGLTLLYDHASVRRWIRDATVPRGRVPELICEVLSMRLGRTVTLQDAGLGRSAAGHRAGPDWQVRHVAEAELYSLTGAGYTELARHQPRYAAEAIARLTLALDLRGADGARNATLDTISLAEAHLADHDAGQAAVVAGNAVLLAQDSASRRVRKRLRELGQQLGPHRTDPGAEAVLDQISALTSRNLSSKGLSRY